MVFFAYMSKDQAVPINYANLIFDTVAVCDDDIVNNDDGSLTFKKHGTYALDIAVSAQTGPNETITMKAYLNSVVIAGAGGDGISGADIPTSCVVIKVKKNDVLTIQVQSTFGNQAVINNIYGKQSTVRLLKLE
jgi:hypothetical protein